MARVFSRKDVDRMIAEAVAKATAPLLERIAVLEAELAKAKKDSSNSSKPPSSDMVKPPKPPAKNRKKRKRGGQPGHKQHLRSPFPTEAVDHFEAYRKYMRQFDVLVQFCLAHLIRDVKFLMTLSGREDRSYGKRVRTALRELFSVIHRREKMTAVGFQRRLEAARRMVLKAATTRVPQGNHAQNLAKRFRQHGDAYFRFITTPDIEPTNNLAEQAIRFVVIDRRITQGTRSETGRRWCERIWTVVATCAQQGRSAFNFLMDSIHAHFSGGLSPSLLPSGP